MKAVDCQGFAGAFTLGAARSGFEVIAKIEMEGGFGVPSVMHNLNHINADMQLQVGRVSDWEGYADTPLVFGNPPCSGFSMFNTSGRGSRQNENAPNARGPRAQINHCMWAMTDYASKCFGADGKRGPEFLVFESVQAAGKDRERGGRVLMRELREDIQDRTGQRYNLTHLFLSGASTGAAQERKRYYLVLHRVPFGIERPGPDHDAPFNHSRAGTPRDAISDLAETPLARTPTEKQKLLGEVSAWANHWQLRDAETVANHWLEDHPWWDYWTELAANGWENGWEERQAAEKYYTDHGEMPEQRPGWNPFETRWGFHQVRRIFPDKPGWVSTGGCAHSFVHYELNRLLTIRELSRLQGFPDSWSWDGAYEVTQAENKVSSVIGSWIGKGVPMQSGAFVSHWVRQSLLGQPGSVIGEPLEYEDGRTESIIDITNDWKWWPRGKDFLEEVEYG